MKYLLDFLSTVQGAPSLQDPSFVQLLQEVAGKPKQDAFYDNLEKIVNELKSSPEAVAFLKPVSKRDAPDYYEVITHPMDLFTIGRHVKTHRYKSKADFARDLDLIWENCLTYNSVETHPLRAAARYMREKADHHLEFLQERGIVPTFSPPPDQDADGEEGYRDDRPNLATLDTLTPIAPDLPECPTMQEPPLKRQRRRHGAPLETTIHDTVASLNSIRQVSTLISEHRRDSESLLPVTFPPRRPHKLVAYPSSISEPSATATIKHISASLLAHAGFEGANEAALDLFTRVATENIHNLGKTFRLLLDGFHMSPEEIVLHALHENGQAQGDLETHIHDLEREALKTLDMERKTKAAYEQVVAGPAIQDDMLLANDGEMLLDGKFADQLGEDFLGLGETGIAAEHGLTSLSVPAAVFYKRAKGPQVSTTSSTLYEPPPAFLPPTIAQLPGLLHAFFSTIGADEPFDATHAAISSNGHITAKVHIAPRKKVEKKAAPKKPGVGKGNWIRPSKEEKARRAATNPPPVSS